MQPTTCFSLERHEGPYDAWPTRSQVLVDGVRCDVRVPGYALLRQFAVADGFLLVTDFDCPYEEATCFALLDADKRLLADSTLAARYGSFNLDTFEWIDERRARVTFWESDRWLLTLRAWGIPIVRPRVHLRRLRGTAAR